MRISGRKHERHRNDFSIILVITSPWFGFSACGKMKVAPQSGAKPTFCTSGHCARPVTSAGSCATSWRRSRRQGLAFKGSPQSLFSPDTWFHDGRLWEHPSYSSHPDAASFELISSSYSYATSVSACSSKVIMLFGIVRCADPCLSTLRPAPPRV